MISKRILKNTLMLYFRQILLILVSLYSVRVVLNTLGVQEYGIYSVVAGIVTLCSFLSGSMASATQRFFSFALGKKDEQLLKSTFSVNLIIYICLGGVIFLLLEGVGLWFVSGHLNIPVERTDAVINLYHFVVATFFFNVITSPFIAIMIAHEDMHYFAMISILEAILKLLAVYSLMYFPWDKLVLYGFLLFAVSIIITSIYSYLCLKKYDECQFKKIYWDRKLLKEICSFTSWSLFGQLSTAARVQAVTILLNQFFNPSVAAARAIAITISSKVNIFSNNFNTGLYPAIVKSYASKKNEELYNLLFNGSKLTFFLMWFFVLPLLIEIEPILQLWLGIVPEHVALFTKLALVESLILSISLPMATAARAKGEMKVYELTLGIIQISIPVIAYGVLRIGYPAYSVFVIAIIINILMFFTRLYIVSDLIGISIKKFLMASCLPILIVVFLSCMGSISISYLLPDGIFYSFLNIVISCLISSIAMYYIGLDKVWREQVKIMLMKKIFNRESKV